MADVLGGGGSGSGGGGGSANADRRVSSMSVVDDVLMFTTFTLKELGTLQSVPEHELSQWIRVKLMPLCIGSTHNYLFVLALLRRMSAEWKDGKQIGHNLQRIIEELEAAVKPTPE
eukprot:jgi/Hompol1/2471/HPOL_000090-RA